MSRTICGMLAVFGPLVFVGAVFGQQHPLTEAQRQYELSGGCWSDPVYMAARANDKSPHVSDIRDVGKSIYEQLDQVREFFKKAEDYLTTKEEKNLLDAGLKVYEASTFFWTLWDNSAGKGDVRKRAETSWAAYTGPFFSAKGMRDDQLMVQIFYVIRATDGFAKAKEDFTKVRSKTSRRVQANVAIAVYKAAGKQYEVDRIEKEFRILGTYHEYPLFFAADDSTACAPTPGEKGTQENIQRWKQVFKGLLDPAVKNPRSDGRQAGSIRGMVYDLSLLMDNGNGLGWAGNPMISKDEFAFIWRQADQCWSDLTKPSEEISKRLAITKSLRGSPDLAHELNRKWEENPVFTYWSRDPDPGEPALLVKVRHSSDKWCSTCGGGVGTIWMRYQLPNSFLKGLCPEWKQAMDDFKKSLPADGVTPAYTAAWNKGFELALLQNGRWVRSASADELKWRNAMLEHEEVLYNRYFFKERLKWHRRSAEDYAKLLVEQQEWFKNHPITPLWSYKQRLCSSFQKLSPYFNTHSTTGNDYYKFSLETMETAEPELAHGY